MQDLIDLIKLLNNAGYMVVEYSDENYEKEKEFGKMNHDQAINLRIVRSR